MADGTVHRYAKSVAFRQIDPIADARTLIEFGRDLYIESLGGDADFRREHGARGERFPAWIASCAMDDPAFAALLSEDDRPIGMVILGADERDALLGHVHHFYIAPSHRGQGFGGLLDEYARAALRRAGCLRARLNVTRRNERALRFYFAQGWVEIAPRRRSILRHMEICL